MTHAPRVTGIRIRPEHHGLRASLFDLEADIMEIVWTADRRDVSVGEVHLGLLRQRTIAYTTVLTTVSRLFDKGLLTRRKDGRRYLYSPSLSRSAFLQATARKVLNSLSDIGREEALGLLVEQVAAADASELDRLEALIRTRRHATSTPLPSLA